MRTHDAPRSAAHIALELHVRPPVDPRDAGAVDDLDPLLDEDLLDLRRDIGILAWNQAVVAVHDRDARAVAPEHLAELEPDVSPAQDHQVSGHGAELHDARRVQRADVAQTRDRRRGGAPAGVDDDLRRREEPLAAGAQRDPYGAAIDKARFAEHEVHVRCVPQVALPALAELLDHALLASADRRQVDAKPLAPFDTVLRAAPREICDARACDHGFGRRAADVDARAADVLPLDDRGLPAGRAEGAG